MLPSTQTITVGPRTYRVYKPREDGFASNSSELSSQPRSKQSSASGAFALEALEDEFASTNISDSTRPKYTHFISFPLCFSDNFAELKQKIAPVHSALKDPTVSPDFDPSWIISPSKYHVTLMMLSLPTEEHIERARQILLHSSALVYDALGSTSLLYRLGGLQTFQPNHSKARVLYAEVAETGIPGTAGAAIAASSASSSAEHGQKCPRTMRVVHILAKAFHKDGLLPESEIISQNIFSTVNSSKKTDKKQKGINFDSGICGMTWHCTIAKVKAGSGKKHAHSMDVRRILEKFGSAEFGVYKVPCLQLNRLSTPSTAELSAEEGEYESNPTILARHRQNQSKNQEPDQKAYYFVDVQTPLP